MRARLLFLLAICAISLPAWAGDIIVVVHPDSPIRTLTPSQLSDLYLGRTRSIDSNQRLLVLDLPRDSDIRANFFSRLNGMNLRRVNAYWARLQFSGDTPPPIPLPDSQGVIDQVRRNPLAIGYVEAGIDATGVRTVLKLRH